MMASSFYVLLVLFLRFTSAHQECPNLVDLAPSWQDGLDASLPIRIDHAVHAWTVILDFDAPFNLFTCWLGEVVTTDNTHVEITNYNWDGDLDIGDVLDLHFQMLFDGDKERPLLIAATFNGKDVCDDKPSESTTQKRTTIQDETTTEHITTPSQNDCDDVVIEESAGPENWHGLIVLSPEEDVHGWTIEFIFSETVDRIECPLAQVTGHGKSWTLTSRSFDDEIPAGGTLEIRFIVDYSGVKPVTSQVLFNGESLCGDEIPETTTEHITTPSQNDCDDVVIEESAGLDNWHGLIVLSPEEDVHGWTIEFIFSETVDRIECPLAEVTGHGKSWTLTSKSFDDEIPAGGTLEIRFIVDHSGVKPVTSQVLFNGESLCGDEIPETTTEYITTPSQTDCDDVVIEESAGPKNWHGLIVLSPEEDVHGWTIEFVFSETVDRIECPLAEVTGHGKSWTLTSKSFDDEIPAGGTLEVRFIVDYSGVKPVTSQVLFNGNSLCGDDNPETTTEHMTTPSQNDCDDVVIEESAGPHDWHGLIVLSPEEDVHGWTIEFVFTETVDKIECPLAVVTGHGKSWTLTSKSFDDEIPAGGTLEIRFIVDYSGIKPFASEVLFNGVSLCTATTTIVPDTTKTPTDCSDVVNIDTQTTNSWTGSINLVPHEDITSWVLVMTFDETVLLISTPLADVTGQGSIWTLKNKEWDGSIDAGDSLNVIFEVDFLPGVKPNLVSAIFNGDDLCQTTTGKPTVTTQQPITTENPRTTLPPVTTPSPTPGKYKYTEVIAKSLLFYEANRSGKLSGDNRIPWRGDSALNDHILGGYYDAGDHVKFGFPMAAMTTILAWGAVSFPGGYEKADQSEWMVKCLKWSTDYFMAAHSSANEFYGQVGDGNADHSYWGRPEDMTMERPAWKIDVNNPGSDLAGETSAALAASSIYFRMQGDDSYADTCLKHAKQLFQFANDHRGVYTNSIPAANFYNSWSGFHDELVWSAAWLAKATQEKTYLEKAEQLYREFDLGGLPSEFSWDDKKAGAQLLMYELTGSSKYKTSVDNFLNYILSSDTTPKGLVWISSSQWGSCRHASNLAHFAFQAAALGVQETEAREFGESQINYILGDGGHSYVVGWGANPPERPHHRSSSCPDQPLKCDWDAFNNPGPNYQVLHGALVGGPDHNDNYVDDRHNFQSNEVATDYNAGFQSSLAALIMLH